tara:strand:- start:16335 stop:16658 length:324 start_codon:yes stop_codon:yes gene_type:complete
MFLIKRKCFTSRENLWKVASILQKICNEYEEEGRSKATIYVSGFSTPSEEYSVSAQWTSESLNAIDYENVPDKIKEQLSKELMSLVDFYEIEFHEVATIEKLKQRKL